MPLNLSSFRHQIVKLFHQIVKSTFNTTTLVQLGPFFSVVRRNFTSHALFRDWHDISEHGCSDTSRWWSTTTQSVSTFSDSGCLLFPWISICGYKFNHFWTNSIFNSHFFGWVDKLRTIVFHKRRAPLVVWFINQVRRGAPTVPSQVGLHLTKLQIPARFFQRIWDLKANGFDHVYRSKLLNKLSYNTWTVQSVPIYS